jgi:hypothetical protein
VFGSARFTIGLTILLLATLSAQGSVDGLKQHVAFLSSDELQGRLTGSDGERRAAQYLARELEAMGALPLPGASGYFHEFDFNVRTHGTVTPPGDAEREAGTGRNVIGLLPADEPDVSRPYTVLGAHYDGPGRTGDGADSVSGVAAVLDAGARLAAGPRPAPIVLAFWSGEAQGLLGASDFVEAPGVPVDEIAAYLNLDEVGAVRDNRLTLRGVGSSSVWPRLIEQTNVVVGFDVRTRPDPQLPTDASVFYAEGVPIVDFFAGGQESPDRAPERADAVNYDDLDRVAHFASIFAQKIGRLDEPPDHVEIARRPGSTVERDDVRPYTGTVPDYAAGVEGLRLSGVADGGPAELAGLRAGDIIVEFAGIAIANVHDYARALGAATIGEPVTVVCLRDGERLAFTLTPTARP